MNRFPTAKTSHLNYTKHANIFKLLVNKVVKKTLNFILKEIQEACELGLKSTKVTFYLENSNFHMAWNDSDEINFKKYQKHLQKDHDTIFDEMRHDTYNEIMSFLYEKDYSLTEKIFTKTFFGIPYSTTIHTKDYGYQIGISWKRHLKIKTIAFLIIWFKRWYKDYYSADGKGGKQAIKRLKSY